MANQACISIGINQYQFFQPLGYGSEDAVAIHHFFVDAAGWDPAQCLLLSDTSPPIDDRSTYPDRRNIQSWLNDWCQNTLVAGDQLWLFFSGHGISTGGEDYLVPLDGKADDLLNTCISLSQLYQQLERSGVNVLVFLDANRACGISFGEGIGAIVTKLAQKHQIPTFLSCQSHEFSHEAAGLGHGLFTTSLLEALNYHPDLNIEILNEYISSRLPELSEHHWKPFQTLVTIVPDGISPYRPVFSSTTQTSISSVPFTKFSDSPPTLPQLDYSTGFTPPPTTPSAANLNISPIRAISKITPIEPERSKYQGLAIGLLLMLLIGAGGGIYAFQSLSPQVDRSNDNPTQPNQ